MSETAVLNAVAGFEPDSNSLIFFKKGWRRQPSLRSPVQADGVYCLSKLEWLCHAMGHEMVHCIVHNACPVSREYDAYKMDNGHGPIFMRLNRYAVLWFCVLLSYAFGLPEAQAIAVHTRRMQCAMH